MVDTNTAVANIDTVELMARFEPEQQMQLSIIKQNIYLEYQRRQTALEVENWRSENSLMLADKENQNKLVQMQHQANSEDQREAMKGQAAVTLANKNNENQLERMQVELQNHKALAEFNTGLSVNTTLMEENGKVRTSMLTRMENSHKVRDEIFKVQAEAVIQEKLAQKQHKRDLEKMQHESNLKQSEQCFQSICLHLSKLLDNSQEEKAKKEIAQWHTLWTKEENKDN
jgi:hypothetical protein